MNIGTLTIEMAANVARLQKDMQRATRTVDGAMGQIRRSADMATRALGGLIGALGAREVINAIDSYTRFNAQLRLATRSTEEFVRAQAYVTAIARESYRDLNSIGVLYARISNSTRELGITQERVVNITRSVALAMQVSGATATESASAMLQLSQAFASGVLRGEEFNAVNEAAPRLMKALADGLNVPIGSLRELAQNGEITSALLADALPKALQELIKESKQIQTISGSFQQLKNEVLLFVGATGEANNVTSSFAVVLGDIAAILSAFNTATEKATGNSQTMKLVLEGIAITFETLAVLGVNLVYVFEMVAREIVGIGKQIGALATLNMDEFNAIGAQMTAYAEQRRAEVDALTERILNARKLAAEARKEAEVGNDILSRAAALNDNFKAAALGAAGAAKEAEKAYDSLLTKLRGQVVKGTAELQAEQQGLNKAQEDFLVLVNSAEWKTYTEAQRILVTNLYKQRIETEKLVDAEKKRKDENAKRLKQMEDDYKEMLDFVNEQDAKAEAERLKALQEMYDEHKRQIEKVGDQLTDALMRAFESGKGFGQAFKDTLVNMFRTMVLRPILAPISGAIAGAFGGGGAMAAGGVPGMGGGGAGMGFLSGMSVAASSLGVGMAAGFSNALTLNFAGSLTAAGQLIGTGTMAGISAGVGMAAGTLLPIVGALMAIPSIGRALFGGGTRVTGSGITGTFTTAGVDARQYVDKFRSGGLFKSSKSWREASPLASDTERFLAESVMAIGNQTRQFAQLLNVNADVIDRINFEFSASLAGLSAEQQQERILGLLDDFSRALAEQLLGSFSAPNVFVAGPFVKEGEKANDALMRLANSLATVNQAFDTLNYATLSASLSSADLASKLIDAFGDINAFVEQTSAFYAEFYTEAERTATTTRQLAEIMGELGYSLPTTRDQFRLLVESQDITTESGREMYAMLLGLAPVFAQISDGVEQIYQSAQEATNTALQVLQRSVAAQQDALRVSERVAQENVNAIRSVFDVLQSSIRGLTGGGFTFESGRAFIAQALQTAQGANGIQGPLPSAEQLQSAISAVTSGLTPSAFASSLEFRREQAAFVSQLTQLQGFTQDQLSTAEKQLIAITDQITRLDEQILLAQNQINELRGINTSVLSVADAIYNLEETLISERAALSDMTSASGSAATSASQTAMETRKLKDPETLIRDLHAAGGYPITDPEKNLGAWMAHAEKYGNINTIAEWGKYNRGTTSPYFQAGGLHMGGVRIVGERGPEMEITGPARYMSNATLASMMGNGNAEEIKALREENKIHMRALVSLQNRMTRLLERWDGDGLPEERAVA